MRHENVRVEILQGAERPDQALEDALRAQLEAPDVEFFEERKADEVDERRSRRGSLEEEEERLIRLA